MTTYYHPKTGADALPTIDYAKILEATSREVRKIVSSSDGAPIMPETVKTLYDLLFQVILNKDVAVNQILSMRSSTSVRNLSPQTFEGMWTIAFALGVVPGYENVVMHIGKVETGLTPVKKEQILQFLKSSSLATSSKSGASDISFSIGPSQIQETGCSVSSNIDDTVPLVKNFGFCSVKYFTKDDQKSVDQYDVTNIVSAAAAAGYTDKDFRVIILANDKAAVKAKFATAIRRYITYIVKQDDDRHGILGREDLEAAFTRLREQVGGRENTEAFVQTNYLGEKRAKPFLSLRFHQELIVRKTQMLIENKGHTSVLWGVVARGGKTYICGGLIRAVQPKVVFIVAGAYTETHTQFTDGLLSQFQDFEEYEVIDVKMKKDKFVYDPAKKYAFFISTELLKGYVDGKMKAKEREIMSLVQSGKIVPDMVFFDEIHKGGTTELADSAMTLISGKAFKVFMTATYIKPFIKPEYGITTENLITWGYEDIQTAKGIESPVTIAYFENKYGVDVCREVIGLQAGRGNSLKDVAAEYMKFPEIQFLTTTFSTEFQDDMKRQNMLDATAGYSMSALFSITSASTEDLNTRYKAFRNPTIVGFFLNYMGPLNTQMSSLDGAPVPQIKRAGENIIDRIGRTSQMREDVLSNIHTQFRPHSQLWFIPQPAGGSDDKPLLSTMMAFASLIMQHPWFRKHFCVVAVSSGWTRPDEGLGREDEPFIRITNGGDDTKGTVQKYENAAGKMGRGLIIIAGKMLTLGVSLPCVNVVALMDDSKSSDLTYQKMFRALTESEGKKIGYVVDMNPVRTLKTLYDYTKVEHSETSHDGEGEPVDITVLTNLYLIDEDQMFVTRSGEERLNPNTIHKALDKHLQASRKVYKSILDEANTKIRTIDFTEEFDLMRNSLKRAKPEALQFALDMAETDVPSGVERIAQEKPKPKTKEEKKSASEEEEKKMALQEMIITAMTLLAFFTTEPDFAGAVKVYEQGTDNIQELVYNTIIDRGLADESATPEMIHRVLLKAIAKTQSKLMEPYRKMHVQLSDLSGDQKEVLEFIEQNLKPKKDQVASRGEVFTPLTLVEEMLNHIPDDAWTHPDYKILDPANGIGNFPVVAFAKLDKGLAEVFPDEKERRKHIVENMLYMTEIDTTNIELSKRLLAKMCGDSTCKFNLISQDFLIATDDVLQTRFGVNRFDIIMGNPPFNSGGVTKGGGTVWPKFVKRAFELVNPGGYIAFVHPPGWRKFYDPEDKDNQGKIWHTIREKGWNLAYINISDLPRFVTTKVMTDYYVIKASDGGAPTKYDCSFKGIVTSGEGLLDVQYIPNLINAEIISVIRKLNSTQGDNLNIVYNQSFKPKSTDLEQKRLNDAKEGVPHYHFTSSAGVQQIHYRKYATTPDYVTRPKVIMTAKAGYERGRMFAFYTEEPMGVTNNSMYMLVSSKEQGDRIVAYLNSDVITFLMKITQYSEPPNYVNEFKILNRLKAPDSMDVYDLTDAENLIIRKVVHPEVVPKKRSTPRKSATGAKTKRVAVT